MGKPNFEIIRHDVVEPILLEVDQIYHLACPASPVHYKYNPVKTIKTNVMGTMNMLGLAKRTRARFLLTSTSEVYGDPPVHPQTEDYWGNVNPIGERSCYDEGKRVAETLTFDYHREHNLEVRVARIFNTYGPRMALDDGRVVSNFLAQALRGESLTVFGDGSQTRSFQYVDDLVAGLVALMDGEHTGPCNSTCGARTRQPRGETDTARSRQPGGAHRAAAGGTGEGGGDAPPAGGRAGPHNCVPGEHEGRPQAAEAGHHPGEERAPARRRRRRPRVARC